MKATAVIGANFGDEGKGLMTDYFSSNDTLVVRYNGGAQAGHTVVTPEGKRHVFSHFGSGSFAGAATFLSRHFIINPMLWKKELKILQELGVVPTLTYSNEAKLTLPYDMLINQEAEKSKGNGRHGSCGVGINETITRCLAGHTTNVPVVDKTRSEIKEKFIRIRDTYCRDRIKQLGLNPDKKFFELFDSDNLLENYLSVLDEFSATHHIVLDRDAVEQSKANSVVFEGAQGLLLDEDHEFFPHVTRSKTGLKNVLELCKEMKISNLDAVYVTRAYMTRHGRGPFPTEDPNLSYKDTTNVHNEFQEGLRFGRLDVDLLARTIDNDLQQTYGHSVAVVPQLAITHVDQVPADVEIQYENQIVKVSGYDDLVQTVAKACNILRVFVSTGSRRNRITPTLVTKERLHV